MTKTEQAQIKKAIRFLAQDDGGGWDEGMEILFGLAGLPTTFFKEMKELKPVSARKFLTEGVPWPFPQADNEVLLVDKEEEGKVDSITERWESEKDDPVIIKKGGEE